MTILDVLVEIETSYVLRALQIMTENRVSFEGRNHITVHNAPCVQVGGTPATVPDAVCIGMLNRKPRMDAVGGTHVVNIKSVKVVFAVPTRIHFHGQNENLIFFQISDCLVFVLCSTGRPPFCDNVVLNAFWIRKVTYIKQRDLQAADCTIIRCILSDSKDNIVTNRLELVAKAWNLEFTNKLWIGDIRQVQRKEWVHLSESHDKASVADETNRIDSFRSTQVCNLAHFRHETTLCIVSRKLQHNYLTGRIFNFLPSARRTQSPSSTCRCCDTEVVFFVLLGVVNRKLVEGRTWNTSQGHRSRGSAVE
mmetsp:Transcript_52753/g.78827  ORF Transcript_52753/g.78827 Transcript_52753/m.78827 type:complete len:308 (-) Transcript_52753:350-1273(-)